jgi:hypothetical protein
MVVLIPVVSLRTCGASGDHPRAGARWVGPDRT